MQSGKEATRRIFFLNGKFTDKPFISAEDRGFLFADAVYEVIRTKNKKPYFLNEHLRRLKRNLKELGIRMPYTQREIKEIIKKSIEKLDEPEAEIYLQITRGAEPRSHLPSRDTKPTFVLIARKFTPLPCNLFKKGVSLLTVEDTRWARCDIKTTMLLANVLAKIQARKKGYFDALFVKNGVITESTSSSFFLIKKNALYTHPADNHILPSITREKIKNICEKLKIRFIEKRIRVSEINNADGAFLCGTTYDVLPVKKINDVKLLISPLIYKIQKEYEDLIKKVTG